MTAAALSPEFLIVLLLLIALAFFGVRWLRRRRAVGAGGKGQRTPHEQPSARPSPAKVFLAYRREDSADITGRIYDKLIDHLGKDQVFKDVDSVPFGVDFRKHVDHVVSSCEIVLVVIGDRWLTTQDIKGQRRLDDPNDLVRLEIEAALRRDIPVVPVLVRSALMPSEGELPASIQALAYRNGIAVRVDPDFHADMDRLLSRLGFRPRL
jgi:hypothetical protein